MPSPRRTPLYERHIAAAAKLVDFAGWEMPVEYPTGLRAEHEAVRGACGIFDVSHMGQVQSSGSGALALLQRMTSNDVSAVELGGAQYGLLCARDGGVLDDLFTYRLGGDRYLTVTNAARHEHDYARLRDGAAGTFGALGSGAAETAPTVGSGAAETAPTVGGSGAAGPVVGGEVELRDRRDELAMVAVQGPTARELIGALVDEELPARMTVKEQSVAGRSMLVCGTGYTGEDGVELICGNGDAGPVWDELVGRGAIPAGLGARDTLRLEACFHLYGNDLTPERNPIEAGLGWCCVEATGFVGYEAVAAVRADGPPEKLVAFAIEGRGIARAGNPVVGGGVVTSGTLSPTLGVAVGLAYVPAERAAVGTELQIDVRGKLRDAVVRKKPLVAKHR
jgi:aminomethyltransferase